MESEPPNVSLREYAKKRDFTKTSEPSGQGPGDAPVTPQSRFCVQRHNASRLHYDFRLEIDGTLKSWAVPKGPSLDPAMKQLAIMVEDHPVDYGDFEGNIPKGSYGGGSVMLWDRGGFELIGDDPASVQIERGDLKFRLHGEKLSGTWAIVRMKNRGKGNEWLLLKKKDEAAEPGYDVEQHAVSVKTGRTQEEIAGDLPSHKKKRQKLPPLPGFIAPMAASLNEGMPKGDNWLFEIKWDGVRGLAYIEDGTVALYTRNNIRCEQQYPELQVMPHYIDAQQAILDGEIVQLDPKGISRFGLIQGRIHIRDANAIAKLAQKNPVRYYAFDLLWLDGKDLRGLPLMERKAQLEKILKPFPLLQYSASLPNAGPHLIEAARESGLEGFIAKTKTSTYESRRSRNWVKIKVVNEQEFLIGGHTPGEREPFGSLVLGYYEDGKLHFAGNVGTGFDAQMLKDIYAKLKPIETAKSPFPGKPKIPKGTVWVRPELVAQIKFAEWTSDKMLRAPVFLGLRNDKDSKAVVREAPVTTRSKLTNLDKIYFPENGYTKGDVLRYYHDVAPLLLPHLKDRPLSLKRYPNGIHADFFFQKNTPANYPSWLRTETIDKIRYIFAEDLESLLYLVNLGCIDHNPAMSRAGTIECPDFILIDLDPHGCEYHKITEAALLVKKKLDAIGLACYPKTTGGDGMHIYIPIEPDYTYEVARSFAEIIARLLAGERPDLFTTPRSVEKREKNKVYFDYMQIAQFKTISSPYSVRAYLGAPISTPLEWKELTPDLHPSQFNLSNAMERFNKKGDLFHAVLKEPQRLETAFTKLDKLLKR